MLDKLKIQNGEEKVYEWCTINYLKFTPDLDLDLKLKSSTTPLKSNSTTSSVKTKRTGTSSCYKRKSILSSKKGGCDDEIDDIFNNM